MTSVGADPARSAAVSPAEQAEANRLAALASYAILDTPPETAFDDLAALAAHLCAAPAAMVTFVEADRQWLKARYGEGAITEMTRERSFCTHALDSAEPLVVPDLRLDPRFAANPSVTGDPHLRFYAGAPLVAQDGYVLGTLCVVDTVPRTLTELQRSHLGVLAAQVVSQLELRRQARMLAAEMEARLAALAALRESQRMLDAVLKHTDVLIYAKDLAGRYVMTNPAHDQTTCFSGDVLRRTDHDLFSPDTAETFRDNDADVVASRQRHVYIEESVHPDGSTHTYRSTKFPLLDDAGTVIGIGGVSTDVSELAAARAAHAEAEQRWRELVEQSPVGVAVVDTGGIIEYANPRAVWLCGASTVAEVQQRSVLDFVPAGDRAAAKAMLATILSGGPPTRAHTWHVERCCGSRLTVEFNASLVTHRGVPAVQLELRDITEAAVEQAELTESERRFRAVFDDSPVAMALLDTGGRWVQVNAAFGDLSGLDAVEVIGTSLYDLVHPDDHRRLHGYDTDRPRGAWLAGQELRIVRPDGQLMWVWMSTNPTIGVGGEPFTLAIIQDVTLRKTAETARQDSEASLAAIADVARCVHTGVDPRRVAVTAVRRLAGANTVWMFEAGDDDSLVVTVSEGYDALGMTVPLTGLSMTAHVWQTGKSVFRPDAAAEPRVDPTKLALDDSVSALWQPVIVDGRVAAIFDVTWRQHVPDPERAVRAVQLIADETGVALQTIRLRQELERCATTDPLTGALNRRAWDSQLSILLATADHAGTPVTIAIVDLDNFKSYNDTHGHSAGDALLRNFAEASRATLRHDDVFARWGGEEFILALPGVARERAVQILDRVRSSVPTAQTCSIGYTTRAPGEPVTVAVARADDALYRAKNLGRDQLAQA